MASSKDPHSKVYNHNNGTQEELLDRLAVSELCKGWCVYRDASEWKNYRSMFTNDAYVWTTWTGPQPVDEFIKISQASKDRGDFIMHRECGTLVELDNLPNTDAASSQHQHRRAIGKMKATISQRFKLHDSHGDTTQNFDVDCDCYFIFFVQRSTTDTSWKTRFVKLIYYKDKVVPIDGGAGPQFRSDELNAYPESYRYLGAAQARLGYRADPHLSTPGNELWEKMYTQMEAWLGGEEVDMFWEPADWQVMTSQDVHKNI